MCERAFLLLMLYIGNLQRAGRQCPPRTCATLGTIRGGDRVSGGVERSETVLEGTACGEGQVGVFLM